MTPIRLRVVVLAFATLGAVHGCSCGDEEALNTESPILQVDLDPLRLDFGPIAEGSIAEDEVPVTNPGRVPLTLTPSIEPGGSEEFAVAPEPVVVGPGSSAGIPVEFIPDGPGEDDAILLLRSDDPSNPEVRVELHGGPIAPELAVDPSPVDFSDARETVVQRTVRLRNEGLSDLHVTSIGVDPAGNPDFSLEGVQVPLELPPGAEATITVVYARSTRDTEGVLLVLSDDPGDDDTGGARAVRLLAKPLAACANGVDDDLDGRIDEDDPGCEDLEDDDELNPAECVHGAERPCGDNEGECRRGTQLCVQGTFGPCEGEVGPTPELCDGLDNDCNAQVDDGVSEACQAGSCAGARVCVQDSGVPGGEWTDCIPVGSSPEVCDDADNDCDGQADEGVVEPCVVNGCDGQRICVPGTGSFTDCQPNDPNPEVCDGLDNDCDGSVDENALPTVCGVGACERQAVGCNGGVPDVCTPGDPSPEVCNGLDDDCNGFADDAIPDTTCGIGACMRTAAGCVNGQAPACTEGQPSPETCNQIDDDCDGFTDESACPVCGNGAVDAGEQCDDGNLADGDGCSSSCQLESCDPDATWNVDQGTISYACCFGITGYDISSFVFSQNGSRNNAQTGPPTMTGAQTSCPAGSFNQTVTIAGGCAETYTLDGSFTSDNTWSGTFTATFVGPDCNCFGIGGEECVNQSHVITATRQ